MTWYVLDTDTISCFLAQSLAARSAVLKRPPVSRATTVVNVEESLTGWYSRLRRARVTEDLIQPYARLRQTVQFFGQLEVLPFSLDAAAIYDDLRPLKLRIGRMDLRIAAIVLAETGVIVTRNVRDFSLVPGLRIEAWS